jgi:hypothetical protein
MLSRSMQMVYLNLSRMGVAWHSHAHRSGSAAPKGEMGVAETTSKHFGD